MNQKIDFKKAENIIKKYKQGVCVRLIAKKYNVCPETIYFTLKKYQKITYKENPVSYRDYLMNECYRIKKRLKDEDLDEEKKEIMLSYYRRIKSKINCDTSRFPSSADVLQ